MSLRTLIIAALALPLWACTNPCLKLAEKVCDCKEVASEVETCKSQAESELSYVDVTSEQESDCDAKLDLCSCALIDTPIGKQNCGLAR